VSAPSLSLATGTAAATTVPLAVTWSGSDAGTFITSYDLDVSTDGGAFTPLWTGVATSLDVQLEPGHTYRFRIRATDANGLQSAWQAGATASLDALEESSPGISFSGTWATVADASAFGGAYAATSSTGAAATYAVSGATVAWMAPKGPTGGAVAIYKDGRLAMTADLYAASPEPRQVVATFAWGGRKSHTLEIRYVGPASAQGALDALVVLH
jgi:hypothetical protein